MKTKILTYITIALLTYSLSITALYIFFPREISKQIIKKQKVKGQGNTVDFNTEQNKKK